MYIPTISDALILTFGIALGYAAKTIRYYTYSPPNLTHRYTYNEIVKFVGGKPMLKHGALCGSRNIAIMISTNINRTDNTLYYRGSFHVGRSPSNPGHQDINFSINKKLNETRKQIYIFVKIRSNEYAYIGTGLRMGLHITAEDKKSGRNVLLFPIRYMSGNLSTILEVLRIERGGNGGSSSSDSS